MPRTPQDVTDAELSVLQVLWELGTASVRELTERLYPGSKTSQQATVKKLLERLESKGCVDADKDCWPHKFQATVSRDELIGRQLQTTADKLCDGSLQPLLSHLVRSRNLSADERASLRGLLEELDVKRKRKQRS